MKRLLAARRGLVTMHSLMLEHQRRAIAAVCGRLDLVQAQVEDHALLLADLDTLRGRLARLERLLEQRAICNP